MDREEVDLEPKPGLALLLENNEEAERAFISLAKTSFESVLSGDEVRGMIQTNHRNFKQNFWRVATMSSILLSKTLSVYLQDPEGSRDEFVTNLLLFVEERELVEPFCLFMGMVDLFASLEDWGTDKIIGLYD